VRSLPSGTPAKEVVAEAADLDDGHVYMIRTLDNEAVGETKGGEAGATRRWPKPKSLVRALRGVIFHVGIDRAKEMMSRTSRSSDDSIRATTADGGSLDRLRNVTRRRRHVSRSSER
jgi:hypothetical protein